MEFSFTPEQESFRGDIQHFLREYLGSDWQGIDPDSYFTDENWPFIRKLTKELAQKGWLTLGWPTKYGGQESSHLDQLIYNEETSYFRAPTRDAMIGVELVGPTLMRYGTQEQKAVFLPSIASGDDVYCQGFSEPESGSDLASLQLSAVRDGDHFVLNGSKIWTSGAHRANRCYLMARTDNEARKHRGISVFIVDMDTVGIEVRPIINMYGLQYFNQIFFSNVRVSEKNMVGDENQGWYVAAASLDFERSGIAQFSWNRRNIEELAQISKSAPVNGQYSYEGSLVRHNLSELWTANEAGRMIAYKIGWMQHTGLVPNKEASISKLMGSEIAQQIANLGVKITGNYGLLDIGSHLRVLDGRLGREWMDSISFTLRAGTSEIQRNIIATRGLGLPRG
ncbi:MAG: acyl-CoA dehydrogenase family protein [Chloroflexota bacterium]|nr:acyl-CoA dehydrogenase family protein [Chloroflexota bacterium]